MTTSRPSLARSGLEQQVDPLRAIEAVHGEDEALGGRAAVVELLRRMWEHLRGEPGRRLEPRRDVARRGEETGRLAERDAVEVLHLAAERALLGRVVELAQRRAVELVRLPELVHEPDALVRMPHEVRRELRRHDEVDLPAVRLVEVEHPPEEGLGQDARARVPLERHRDEVGLVPPCAELLDEPVREDLGAASFERHLRPAHGDPHRRPRTRRATKLAPWYP